MEISVENANASLNVQSANYREKITQKITCSRNAEFSYVGKNIKQRVGSALITDWQNIKANSPCSNAAVSVFVSYFI